MLKAVFFGKVARWGPIWPPGVPWRPKADFLEAEGRLNGGLGAEPPGEKTFFFSREGATKSVGELTDSAEINAYAQWLLLPGLLAMIYAIHYIVFSEHFEQEVRLQCYFTSSSGTLRNKGFVALPPNQKVLDNQLSPSGISCNANI